MGILRLLEASKRFRPKRFDATKKEIVQSLVKDKKMSLRYGRPLKTKNTSNPMMKAMYARKLKSAYK